MKALLLDALRGLDSRRVPTLVASGGLILALAACLLVALLAIALSKPDPAISHPGRVVLLDFKGNPPGQPSPWFTRSPMFFAKALKDRNAPLDLISRAVRTTMDINHEGRIQRAYLLIADPDLIPLLGLKALHGDLRATLTRHDGIAVTPGLVRKLWGELPPAQALGRKVEARGIFSTVTAIIPNFDPRSPVADPVTVAGDAEAMVGVESQGNPMHAGLFEEIYMVTGRVLARLRPEASVDSIGGWMRAAFTSHPRYSQLPVEWRTGREAAYFRGLTLKQLPFAGAENELRWRLLAALAAAGALLLMLAAFNCMNLQTASLLLRQRETALRRSLGADSAQLLSLWGAEVLLPLLFAAAGALLLAWFLAPGVANWLGLSPAYSLADPVPWQAWFGMAITVMLLLALVLAPPAWRALRRIPALALQGRTMSEGPWGRRTRQALLALQMAGAVLLLVLAGVLASQQRHLLHADRGFDTRNRLWIGVMVDGDQAPNMDEFFAALGRHPAVEHWAFGGGRPAAEAYGFMDMYVGASQRKQLLRLTTVSPSFFATYGMTLLAGSPRTGSGETHVVLDARAARMLGFSTPQAAVGALVRGGGDFMQEGNEPRRVVAVVKDVRLGSAREPALPQGFLLSDQPMLDFTVHGTDLPALRQAVEQLWAAHGPKAPYQMELADEQRAWVYRQEQQMTTMLAAVALLSVGVAMLGAYALVSDTLRRRRTELVLHRLHGAGHAAIVRVVTGEFVVPLLVAAALGLPLGAWLGQWYLAGFVDRVSAGSGIIVPMLVACVAILLVTAISALRHVRQALTLQPVEALR